MTKLYYTCPIQAAYMAKEFGVEYTKETLVDEVKHTIASPTIFVHPHWSRNQVTITCSAHPDNIYHIHPDSLHIFEPQVGDMDSEGFVFDDDGYWYIDVDRWYNPGESGAGKIIQRNDKQFFWPLTEEE